MVQDFRQTRGLGGEPFGASQGRVSVVLPLTAGAVARCTFGEVERVRCITPAGVGKRKLLPWMGVFCDMGCCFYRNKGVRALDNLCEEGAQRGAGRVLLCKAGQGTIKKLRVA